MLGIFNAAQKGDFATVTRLHQKTYAVNTQLFCAPNPIPLKWALGSLGLCENVLRLPLSPLEESDIRVVAQALESVKTAGIEIVS